MEKYQIQHRFFEKIKMKLPPNISLAVAVAEILDISIDSAYRRIRCEKQISLDELQKLSNQFKISLDELLLMQSDSFIFNGRITNNSDFKYENWLETCVYHLETIGKYTPNHMYYLAKEIPFFYYFLIPEIAALKSFFFMKSILDYEDWKNVKFSVKDDYSKYLHLCKKISDTFASIPSTEIWSIENITSTIQQIEFYRVTGSLKSDEDALILYDKLDELINHIEKQAECGYKLRAGQESATSGPAHRMFVNEITMGDNMQIMKLGNTQLTYINHSIINFITTADLAFNTYMKQTFDNIAQKSTPISIENQKDRLMFFNRLRGKVTNARKIVLQN